MNKVISREYVEKNYIHKDKIKEKIEEVEIELENYEADKINVFSGQTYMEKFKLLGKLYILKELLEDTEDEQIQKQESNN